MRAISARTSAARFAKFSGQCCAQTSICRQCAASASTCFCRSPGAQGRTMLRGKGRHKNGTQPFRTVTVKSTAAVLLWTRSRVRLHSRRQKSAPAVCESSTSILRTPNPGSLQTAARFDAHQILRRRRTRILGSSRVASGSMPAGSRSHGLQNRSGSSAQTRDHFRPRVVPLKAGRRPRAGSC